MTDERRQPTLLVVHRTPSPATRELLESVLGGANDPEFEGVTVRSLPALGATIPDLLGTRPTHLRTGRFTACHAC
ncbi:hypothetical protein [Rhodococcus maanshanensis]|uniref:Uncharacterized protein n=1 Tax=Rhodococcus maanshanensis TaxID=183556 RepID=A0A1H7G731_9NOCA|nr:hypothetical protein [Rhodococcus maanshanensis]SEK33949.1 hypothetical protein SAMN05444583_101400 [Rhodococcus maanshanensis]